MLPDEYESEATFFVGKTRLDEVMNANANESSLVAKVRRQMLLTPVLLKVARETDLDLRATSDEEKEGLIRSLAENIQIIPLQSGRERPGNETIFRISYRDVDRNMSLRVVDTILDTFRDDVVSGRATGSDDALEFLESGIADYGTQLSEQEQLLADFKRKNVGLLPGAGGGYFATLQSAQEASRQIRAELSVLMERRTALMGQLKGERPVMSDGATSVSGIGQQSDLDSRITQLESHIQSLLTTFTEKWPDVIAARDQLEQLYLQREERQSSIGGDFNGAGIPSNNPVYQEIQIALNETNINIAELERRLGAARAKVSDLQAKIDVIPKVEAELAELTRDYDQIRSVYTDMRAKYEQESLRRKRLGWDGVTFETMEPPRVGLEPVAPKRILLLFLTVAVGLGAAVGVAFLLQQLKPVFVDASSLRRATGLPVLGSVSMVRESEHKGQRRRELLAFLGATAMILVVALLLLVFLDSGVEAGIKIRELVTA